MATKFRKIEPRVWDDEKFRRLTIAEKLLAIWILTGPRTLRCGFVLWSAGLASDQTGIPVRSGKGMAYGIETVCHTVCHTLNWGFDPANQVIFLPRWYRYNGVDNAKHLKGCLSDLQDVPRTELLLRISEQKAHIPEKLHTVWEQGLIPYRNSIETVSPQEQEQEQEQEQDTSPQIPPKRKFVPPSLEEVAAFCLERHNKIDPEEFLAHYEANGWVRGRTKVKDWKACIRTWEAKARKESQPSKPRLLTPEEEATWTPYGDVR